MLYRIGFRLKGPKYMLTKEEEGLLDKSLEKFKNALF